MTDVVDLAAARRANADGARQLRPRDALLNALEALDAGSIEPTHIVVCWYEESTTGFFQAGTASNVTATGILHRVCDLIWSRTR
jgi:hypothetical protein